MIRRPLSHLEHQYLYNFEQAIQTSQSFITTLKTLKVRVVHVIQEVSGQVLRTFMVSRGDHFSITLVCYFILYVTHFIFVFFKDKLVRSFFTSEGFWKGER